MPRAERVFSILNMRSTPLPRTPDEDLNTPARIRDAAIRCFAADGFRKTSIRAIAAVSEVSPGLVIHHFGSKEKLRETCDDYVLQAMVERANNKANPIGLQAIMREYLADPEEYNVDVAYLGKALAEDSPAGRKFADIMTDETEAIIKAGIADGSMNPTSDIRVVAAMIVMTSLSILTMPGYLSRTLGFDAIGPELMRRMALPSLELYTHGLYADDTFLKAARETLAATSNPRKESRS